MEDQEILSLIQLNDIAGFKAAFDKYYKPLCTQAFLLLRDEDQAQDLVQELFIQLWQKGRLAQVQQSLYGYLSISVRNNCLNALKKQQQQQEKETAFLAGTSWFEEKNALELAELSKELESAVGELPDKCRQIFQMVFVENKKYQEAADEAGVSINTVKTQLKRGLVKLREQLGKIR
ncbi:RNA polymerase sigma factor [Flavihumibacter petaseus]|nr:RNA polymerase sigma-70 factor [Flavihumibacter petaseus]